MTDMMDRPYREKRGVEIRQGVWERCIEPSWSIMDRSAVCAGGPHHLARLMHRGRATAAIQPHGSIPGAWVRITTRIHRYMGRAHLEATSPYTSHSARLPLAPCLQSQSGMTDT